MLSFRPHWAVGIILVASFVYALPSHIPPDRLPQPLVPRELTIAGINSTVAQCVAGTGLTISKFIIFNYIALAFTIIPGAGYRAYYAVTFSLAVIFLPYYGLMLAFRKMQNCTMDESDPIKRAGRSSALCVVARTKGWRPTPGDEVWYWRSSPPGGTEAPVELVNYAGLELEYLVQKHVQIHGKVVLPDGYLIARLPPDYEVEWDKKRKPHLEHGNKRNCNAECSNSECSNDECSNEKCCSISSSYSISKTVVAFFQLLSAGPTIYQASSAESRENYGYAAYQLTVIPFALMAIINTLANLSAPSYGASYLVRSHIMDEAERRGGVFEGVVGHLKENTEELRLDRLVEGHERIIGQFGKFRRDTNHGGTDGNSPSHDEADGNPPTHNGTDVNSPLLLTFADGPSYKYPGPKQVNKRNPFFRAMRKASHFIFRHHIWEAIREEFPIFRWFLTSYELKVLRKTVVNKEQAAEKLSEKQDPKLVIEAETQTNTQAETELTKIYRLTPHRTNIFRLFKRFSERERMKGQTQTKAMILRPAIGNPTPRKKANGENFMYYFTDILFVLSIAAPYLITYSLTGYEPGKSRTLERLSVVLWVVMMQLAFIPQRIIWNFIQTKLVPLGNTHLMWGLVFVILSGAVWSIPGFMGFFFVFEMMIDDNKSACNGTFIAMVNKLNLGYAVTNDGA